MAYETYLVPKDTARILKNHLKANRNFGLALDRYVPNEAIAETDRFNDRGRSIGKERNFWLQAICKDFTPDDVLISSTFHRWLKMTEGSARFGMMSRSRLMIGLGSKGALEFGLTLHPVTGLPYIPGSALKGLCRNYMLYDIAEKSGISLDPSEGSDASEVIKQLDEKLSDVLDTEHSSLYRKLFGTQGNAGECIFYDAIIEPTQGNTRLFVVEVMTPHFRKYYESSGKDVPHDADDPNPITYLAVNTGITFALAVGSRLHTEESPQRDARDLLRRALSEMGIGAKTAAGYGIFAPVKPKKKS
jgi:CRISPR-associated protein Cmr6